MLVGKPLMEKYKDQAQLGIADDMHTQTFPTLPEHIVKLAEWTVDYVRLMKILNMVNNVSKFKLMQSEDAIGTILDVAKYLHLFPTGERTALFPNGEPPTIVRTATLVNGGAVGPCTKSRTEMTSNQVGLLEEKCKVLDGYTPLIGCQIAEMYLRYTYRTSASLNHQARAIEPTVAAPALQRASEAQTKIFRGIAGVSEGDLPDTHGPGNVGPRADDNYTSESFMLPTDNGGCGYVHPLILSGPAHAGKVVNILGVIRRMKHLQGHIGTPSSWGTSVIKSLREAYGTISEVLTLKSFAQGPPRHKEEWTKFTAKLRQLDASGDESFDIDEIESVGKCGVQRVLYRAVVQEIFQDIVNDPGVEEHVRIRLRSCAQPGSGAWCTTSTIRTGRFGNEMSNVQFRAAFSRRLGCATPMVVNSSRCVCKNYDINEIPEVPGIARNGIPIRSWFHDRGLHWDYCKHEGGLIARHNNLSSALAYGLRKIGYSVTVAEIQLGISDKDKGGNGKPQRGDWSYTDWQHGNQQKYGDTTVWSPFGRVLSHKYATGASSATGDAEYAKHKLKGAALSGTKKLEVAAFNTMGGMGDELYKIISDRRIPAQSKGGHEQRAADVDDSGREEDAARDSVSHHPDRYAADPNGQLQAARHDGRATGGRGRRQGRERRPTLRRRTGRGREETYTSEHSRHLILLHYRDRDAHLVDPTVARTEYTHSRDGPLPERRATPRRGASLGCYFHLPQPF